MDPLSVSASIIAILQMTGHVIQYINGVRGSPTERERFNTELVGINNILIQLQGPAEEAEQAAELRKTDRWSETLQSLNQPNGPLKQLEQVLRTLESKLAPACGLGSVKKALIWPFQKEEVRELIATIERQKTLLNLARQNDHIKLSKATKDDVEQISKGVTELQISGNLREIQRWLSAPDSSINHNAAIKKRSLQTGSWFTEGREFTCWKTDQSSNLWLHGIPGSGKTILSSTIIQNIGQTCLDRPGVTLAYFYFNFNESPRCEKMLRSVLMQLSSFSADMSHPLNSLFSSCQNGLQQPTLGSLLTALRQTMKAASEVFLILDALDECEIRDELLECLSEIAKWKEENLHLLVTSRKEPDIDERLSDLIADNKIISIQSSLVKNDICAYVRDRLQTDRKLKRWRNDMDIQREIEATLMGKANGMFRWVSCQLDLLGGCLTKQSLRQALKSLPKDLDSTYDRILGKITEENKDHAFKILQWLAYAARPLRLVEIAEVVAIDVLGSPRFDVERRLVDPWDVMAICPNLLTTAKKKNPWDQDLDQDDTSSLEDEKGDIIWVRLAHFSVKEYLVSSRIQQGMASFYSIREVKANTVIAETCLAYLLQFDQPDLSSEKIFEDFPLASYAADYWHKHSRVTEDAERVAFPLGLDLLSYGSCALLHCIRFSDPDRWDDPNLEKDPNTLALPLYYASAFGLLYSVTSLLDEGADINAKGGRFGTALQVAASKEHNHVLRLLIERGAHVNAVDGADGSALAAACAQPSSLQMVPLLLHHGAEINVQGGYYGNALQAASIGGKIELVQLLLHHGADINAQGGFYGNALQAVSYGGNIEVVQLLLHHGADINAQGGRYGNALQAAMQPFAHIDAQRRMIRLLIQHGAQVGSTERRQIRKKLGIDFFHELGFNDEELDQ